MKITGNLIRQVVCEEDAKGCAQVAEAMKMIGYTAAEIERMVKSVTGIDAAEWDELVRVGES